MIYTHQEFAHRNCEEPEFRNVGRELGNEVNHRANSVRLGRHKPYQREVCERFTKVRDDAGDQGFQIAEEGYVDSQTGQPPVHLRDMVYQAHRKAEGLEPRKERFWNDGAEMRV